MQEIKELISEEQLTKKIKELGEKISKDYEGKEIIVVCILRGGVMFTVDLSKEITVPLIMDFMAVSSYGNEKVSSGRVKIIKDLDESIEGKDVLIIEDIVDSGRTLNYLVSLLSKREPNSIKICTLLDKIDKREQNIKVDYIGFEIPDKFVIGYGLDYNQKYRNLKYIGYVEE